MAILRQLLLVFGVYVLSVILCAASGGVTGKLIAVWIPHYYPSVFSRAASQPDFDATGMGIATGIGQGAAGLLVGSVVVLALAIGQRKRTADRVLSSRADQAA